MTDNLPNPCPNPHGIEDHNPHHPVGNTWDPIADCLTGRANLDTVVKRYVESTEFESFFDHPEDDPDYPPDVVTAYMTARSDAKAAHATGNHAKVRRHRGELEAANAQIDRMDLYDAHHALTLLHTALNNELEQELTDTLMCPVPAHETAPDHSPTDDTERFGGHAPNYRRGRAYALNVEAAARNAIDNRPPTSLLYEKQADALLGPLGDNNNPEDLRDFIAGVAREAENQLERLRNHFCTTADETKDPQ